MEKPTFPRRFFTKGSDPESDKSIGYYSNNTKLFAALTTLLTDDEWAELEESPLGVFFRFVNSKFSWASMIVKCMLNMQIVCKKPFEIWSVVGSNPVRFSLHEFEHITGLNCEYRENLKAPLTADIDENEFSEFWEKLGVHTKFGPSVDNLTRACGWAQDWSKEDRKRLAYLAVYAGFIVGERQTIATPVEMAKLVMDLEEFEGYPWGRVAFLNLIESVKSANLTKHYYINRFVEVLQVWSYYAMPSFGQDFGEPVVGRVSPTMMAFKGMKGRKNIMQTLLAQVNFNHMIMVDRDNAYPRWDNDVDDEHIENVMKAFYGELGGTWRWKPSDWISEGVIVLDKVKEEKGIDKKRHLDSGLGPSKRPCPAYGIDGHTSGASWDTFQSTVAAMFEQFSKQQTGEIGLRFDRLDEKVEVLTSKISCMESTIEKLQIVMSEEEREAMLSPTMVLRFLQTGSFPTSPKLQRSNSNAAQILCSYCKFSARIAAKQTMDESDKLENPKLPPIASSESESETPEEESCELLREYFPTKEEKIADLKRRQPKDTAKVIDAKARKTERLRTLAQTQNGIYVGSSTVKRMFSNKEPRGRGYDPFRKADKQMKEVVLDHYKSCPGLGKKKTIKTVHDYPLRFWWYDLLNQNEWLIDTHMNAAVYLLRTRLLDHPEWFRSDRFCLVDTTFGQYWTAKYDEFKMIEPNELGEGRPLPTLSYDYYKGVLPEPRPTNKIWGVDIDELYIPFNLNGDHWVALFVSLPKRHITIYDSKPSHVKPGLLASLIEPVTVMFPYLMRQLADEDKKYEWTLEPFTYDRPIDQASVPQQANGSDCGVFTLKFIECHALGIEFPQTLCHKNIPSLRLRLAYDLFEETGVRGPKERDWSELD
ncbi:unnamed protein product [Microthlaspi erraticum]|uniref:Ubiquitin-like protease family profile domain-containing protein n=1 Tax=Microthlaspi erraticum TaxID=1685480 RepID=A0A6D2L9N7_9BRAS|nr:unnamed protein product [Microthlaspi erraticum]